MSSNHNTIWYHQPIKKISVVQSLSYVLKDKVHIKLRDLKTTFFATVSEEINASFD